MKFKTLSEPIATDDKFYDTFDGGYIKPSELLEDQEDIDKVNAAIRLVDQFLSQAEDEGSIEFF